MNREELMDLFSEKIRELLARLPVDYEEVQEIRLRAACSASSRTTTSITSTI